MRGFASRLAEWLRSLEVPKAVALGLIVPAILWAAWFALDRINPFSNDESAPADAADVLDRLADMEVALEKSGAILNTSFVQVYVRPEGADSEDWATDLTAAPGDRLELLVRFENVHSRQTQNTVVGVNLPRYNDYVEGSTVLSNSNYPVGVDISTDNVIAGGILVGDYDPGATGYVKLTVELDPVAAFQRCGSYELAYVGLVGSDNQNTVYNTAKVGVVVDESYC